MERIHVVISGKVQGVGFRYSTYHKAVSLGLKGWVINTPEGNVEIMAEGTENNLVEFLNWCHSGPSMARVRDVQILEHTRIDSEKFKQFEIEPY